MAYFLVSILGYVLGCANLARLLAKRKGVDLASGGSGNLLVVLGICVFPFLLSDLAKIFLALFLVRRLKPFLR